MRSRSSYRRLNPWDTKKSQSMRRWPASWRLAWRQFMPKMMASWTSVLLPEPCHLPRYTCTCTHTCFSQGRHPLLSPLGGLCAPTFLMGVKLWIKTFNAGHNKPVYAPEPNQLQLKVICCERTIKHFQEEIKTQQVFPAMFVRCSEHWASNKLLKTHLRLKTCRSLVKRCW